MPVQEARMPKIAKIFMNNRSQSVRIPKEFQFSTKEVYIRKEGDEVILSPRPKDWSAFLAGPPASPEFMEGYEDLPVEDIEL
jgi:antitoxin VapB